MRRADEVIDQTAEDFVARTKDITGGDGAYSALDPIAGTATSQVSCAQCLLQWSCRNGVNADCISALRLVPIVSVYTSLAEAPICKGSIVRGSASLAGPGAAPSGAARA